MPSEEVEIRVVLEDQEEALEVLRKKADLKEELRQVDSYFVPEDRDFFDEDPTEEYLRVREDDSREEVGYHLNHLDEDGSLLYTDEWETEVGDAETMKKLLEKIGMLEKVVVDKRRKVFEYGDFELLLDHIEGLGYFLEVEAKDVEGSVEEKRDKCFDVLESLDLDWNPAPDMGYPDMLL